MKTCCVLASEVPRLIPHDLALEAHSLLLTPNCLLYFGKIEQSWEESGGHCHSIFGKCMVSRSCSFFSLEDNSFLGDSQFTKLRQLKMLRELCGNYFDNICH